MLGTQQPTNADLMDLRELDKAWERFCRVDLEQGIKLFPLKLLGRFSRRARFKDATVERGFRKKLNRIKTAIALGVPDRVPIATGGVSFYPAYYSGISFADYLLERKKCEEAFLKFVRENTWFDAIFPSHMIGIGSLIRMTQVDVIKMPGVQLPGNVPYQFVERERLLPEEYPDLIAEGFDFFKRVILPRTTPLYDPHNGWGKRMLMAMGKELMSFGLFYTRMLNIVEYDYGVPMLTGPMLLAPYDLVAFFLRGLTGVSGDLFRRPEMVEQVTGIMVPGLIKMYEIWGLAARTQLAMVVCERAFSLSPRQFARFVLPDLKRIVDALILRGMVPIIVPEGECTHLFECMKEFPPGKCACYVDSGDIFQAKKILKGHMCVAGNMPLELMVIGKPKDIREYCKRLLQEVAPGGGYIGGPMGIPEDAKPENIRIMMEYLLEHGKY